MRGRRKPEQNGHVDVDDASVFSPPPVEPIARGTATLEDAKEMGKRLGEDEVRRRNLALGKDADLDKGKAEGIVTKAIAYAEFFHAETGRLPL